MDTAKNAYKLSQAIKKHGLTFAAARQEKNKFHEPTGNTLTVLEGCGLFHTDSGYLNISVKESGLVSGKNSPMLLILYTDKLKTGDELYIGENSYTISGIENPGGLGIALDLSLEVIKKNV